MKKTIAILLAVLFLLTVTASAASNSHPAKLSAVNHGSMTVTAAAVSAQAEYQKGYITQCKADQPKSIMKTLAKQVD